ncbi:hypothetical protein AAGG52_22075 [Bacillus licheniformis]
MQCLFQYQNIGKNSIVMREGLISSTKHYDMEDVTSVHAYYQKGLKDALYLKYDLTLNDGKKSMPPCPTSFTIKRTNLICSCSGKEYILKEAESKRKIRPSWKNMRVPRRTIK